VTSGNWPTVTLVELGILHHGRAVRFQAVQRLIFETAMDMADNSEQHCAPARCCAALTRVTNACRHKNPWTRSAAKFL
jgi:hypothetical protein